MAEKLASDLEKNLIFNIKSSNYERIPQSQKHEVQDHFSSEIKQSNSQNDSVPIRTELDLKDPIEEGNMLQDNNINNFDKEEMICATSCRSAKFKNCLKEFEFENIFEDSKIPSNYEENTPKDESFSKIDSLDLITVDEPKIFETSDFGDNIRFINESDINSSIGEHLNTIKSSDHSNIISDSQKTENKYPFDQIESQKLEEIYLFSQTNIQNSHIKSPEYKTNQSDSQANESLDIVHDLNVTVESLNKSAFEENNVSRVTEGAFNDTIEEMERLLQYGMTQFPSLNANSEFQTNKETTVPLSEANPFECLISNNNFFLSTEKHNDDYVNEPLSYDYTSKLDEKALEEKRMSEKKKSAPPKPPRITVDPTVLESTSLSSCVSTSSTKKNSTSAYKSKLPVMKNKSNILSYNNTPISTSLKTKQQPLFLATKSTVSQFKNKSTPKSYATPTVSSSSKYKTHSTEPFKNRPVSPFVSNNIANHLRSPRMQNIISPVAKYLQDNPPPPLIATVRPRHNINCEQLAKEMATLQTKDLKQKLDVMDSAEVKLNLNNEEDVLHEIDKRLNNLTLKVNAKAPLKDANGPKRMESAGGTKRQQSLPDRVYIQAKPLHLPLENKENVPTRRQIPSDRPPITIIKHIGRVKMAKQDSPGLERSPEASANPDRRSLMEVSLYEPHSAIHTNTLR